MTARDGRSRMSIAYLGLGSNVDARANIHSGIAALRASFGEVALSPIYRAPAVGFSGDDFINLVARIETGLGPLELRDFLHALEDHYGRDRSQPKFSDRTLDIDILLYDDLYLLSPLLEIPRDEILTAAHVLRPLADLAPDLRHPVLRRGMAELWREFRGERSGLEVVDL
jgi:2-amino-4-hydroxy-6-hydroxymethyldihydropteridine diphosphokinase